MTEVAEQQSRQANAFSIALLLVLQILGRLVLNIVILYLWSPLSVVLAMVLVLIFALVLTLVLTLVLGTRPLVQTR